MIHALRQRHRRLVYALAVFLPVTFSIGIVARKPAPIMNTVPPSLIATPRIFDFVEWERNDLFAKVSIQAGLWREQKGSGRFAVRLSAVKDLVKPDLIVYWVAGNPKMTDTLPDDAILLGSFYTPALPLTDEETNSTGALLLYSLADNEVVDVSKPFNFTASTN